MAHSSAVKLFRKDGDAGLALEMDELTREGVRFPICNNSLAKLKIDRAGLLELAEVVPAGIVELIRLQQEGFAYVKT